jgi:hypothetical protein
MKRYQDIKCVFFATVLDGNFASNLRFKLSVTFNPSLRSFSALAPEVTAVQPVHPSGVAAVFSQSAVSIK